MIEEKIKAIMVEIEHLNKHVHDGDFEKNRAKRMKLIRELIELKKEKSKKKGEEQKIPKATRHKAIVKRIVEKEKKRDKKLLKAIEGGAKLVEKSISKVGWDIARGKIKEVQSRLNYKAYWVLDCAADMIFMNKWFNGPLGEYLVAIPYKDFIDFIGRPDVSSEEAVKIFKQVRTVILEGDLTIPIYDSEKEKVGWITLKDYGDNICGQALAHESAKFEKYRSDRKMKGKGAGKEEPVFILLFFNYYGKWFFHNACHREAIQLMNKRLYKLRPEAQELFQKIRWNEKGPVIMNVEGISRAVGWVWPPGNIYDRAKRCQVLLDLLYEENFINRPIPRGKSIEKRDWLFYVSKGRGVITEKHRMKLIKNHRGCY